MQASSVRAINGSGVQRIQSPLKTKLHSTGVLFAVCEFWALESQSQTYLYSFHGFGHVVI